MTQPAETVLSEIQRICPHCHQITFVTGIFPRFVVHFDGPEVCPMSTQSNGPSDVS